MDEDRSNVERTEETAGGPPAMRPVVPPPLPHVPAGLALPVRRGVGARGEDARVRPLFARAAGFMLATGAMLVGLGGLLVWAPTQPDLPWDALVKELMEQQGKSLPPGITAAEVKRLLMQAFVALGVLAIVTGLAEGVLAHFVRQGRRRPAVAAQVVTVLLLGMVAFQAVNGVVSIGSSQAVASLVLLMLPAALLVAQLRSLGEALRAARALAPSGPVTADGAAEAAIAAGPASPVPPPGEAPIYDIDITWQRLPPPPTTTPSPVPGGAGSTGPGLSVPPASPPAP